MKRNKKESEKKIEKTLVKAVKESGGMCIKFLPYMLNGFPDRICLFPDGECVFVEIKSEGEELRKLQEVMFKKLKTLGFFAYTVDREQDIEMIIAIHG